MFDRQSDAFFRGPVTEYRWYRLDPEAPAPKVDIVRALCFTEFGNVFRVKAIAGTGNKKTHFPGGRVVNGDNPLERARTRVLEEAALEIDLPQATPLGVVRATFVKPREPDKPWVDELYIAVPVIRILRPDSTKYNRMPIEWAHFYENTPNNDVLRAINDCAAEILPTFRYRH